MIKKSLIYVFLFFLILAGCKKEKTVTSNQKESAEQTVYLAAGPDSSAVLVADSVIYTVFLKNPDTLDQWQAYSLRYVNRDKLVDLIFEGVYSGQLTAYSYRDWIYGDRVVIPVDSVKSLEAFKDRVGQIEFVERWFYSPKTHTFYKQVLEATLAYELYDSHGKVRGYAPLFKVLFNGKGENTIAK